MDEPRPSSKLDKRFVVQDQSYHLEQGCRTRPFLEQMSLLSPRVLEHSEELMFLYHYFKQTLFLPCAGPRGLYQGVPDRPAEASDDLTRRTPLELDTDKTYI
jgi:hypothetical protein